MADEEVATKAPESDATEAQSVSGIAGDTKPDQGAASMGVRLLCRLTTKTEAKDVAGALHERPSNP